MGFKRGSIHLANLNPARGAEPGKTQPCVVMQSELLNDIDHETTLVIPMTTQLVDDTEPLRFRIPARDQLHRDSDVMLDQTRTVDNGRIGHEKLTALTERELVMVEEYWKIVLGLDD